MMSWVNLDLAPDTDIDFSTVLLAQDVTTVDPGNVPVLTVRVLKTAHITIPSSEVDRIPTDERFDEAVESMFADVQQKQELVWCKSCERPRILHLPHYGKWIWPDS